MTAENAGIATARSIAVAQTIPVRAEVDLNLETHLRLVHLAADAGAQVVVFPEMSITGYELDLARPLAFSETDPRLATLRDVSATKLVTIVVGAPFLRGSHLYIGAFIVSPDRTVSLYTKHHLGAFGESARRDGVLPPAEATVFEPGSQDPLIACGTGNTAAVAICADIGHPAHPRHAVARGARTYLASMFVIPSEYDSESTKLRSYARRHKMVVALANFGGPSGGLASAGGSAIWDERGEPLVRLAPRGSGVAIAIESDAGWRSKTFMLAAT
ncbi:MAG: carbon-nitrogen hydrolase family protein [Deltaproteobacteria bacterium]|nr:carbon-nitrogen hydrolase family protein [Deltaproteobacteria bacterium]